MKLPNFSFIFYKFRFTSYNFDFFCVIFADFCYLYAIFSLIYFLLVEIETVALMTLCHVCNFKSLQKWVL